MRSFYHEEHAAAPEHKRGPWGKRLIRWATVAFATGCVLVDARIVHMAGFSGDTAAVILRIVLLELEGYLAIVVALLTFRILPYRTRR